MLIPTSCDYVTLHGKRDFAGVMKFKDLEMGRLSWLIKVDPVESHASLKVENLSQLQRDGILRRTQPAVAGFEDGGRAP